MITFIFSVLLIIFLAAFFGFGYGFLDVVVSENVPSLSAYLAQIGITTTQIQILLGIGVLFCQFAIILFSMLDKIGATILAVIKPVIRLIPLIAFLTSIWSTYAPVLFNVLPDGVANAFGVAKVDNYMAQAVSDGTFARGVIITLLMMLLFVITTMALGRPEDSARVKALKDENAKLRKQLRSL